MQQRITDRHVDRKVRCIQQRHPLRRLQGGDDQPEPKVAKVVGVNGASNVFSSAREYLMLVTSRGPWGQLRLPAMSFADLEVAAADEEK